MLHERHKKWIDARGIDPELAEKFGLATERDAAGHWITVPYLEGGKVINRKWRMTNEKRHHMDTGAPLLLWNSEALSHPGVLAGEPVVITEGEWDALIAIQSGAPHVVSVPNGAPSSTTDKPEEAQRYAWVYRHLSQLERVRQFIIAADDDEAGQRLAHDLVSLLGADRCRWIKYPEGCKDLNDVALSFGHNEVLSIIAKARPYPIKGLFTIDEFPPRAPIQAITTGIPALDPMMSIVPGTLTVFTGYANIGKSTVLNSIVGHLIEHNIPVCMAPFETDVPILLDGIRQAICRCGKSELSRIDMRPVDQLIRDNITLIYQAVDADDEMDLDWFLDRGRAAVLQYGARVLILDPWNELEHKRRRDETETEYVGRSLRAIKRFARKFNVAVWIVAHPSKPMDGHNGVPKLYQISGSAHWANKADYGLTYHRKDPSKNAAELHVTKVRMGLPGEKGKVNVMLDYWTWGFVLDTGAGVQ